MVRSNDLEYVGLIPGADGRIVRSGEHVEAARSLESPLGQAARYQADQSHFCDGRIVRSVEHADAARLEAGRSPAAQLSSRRAADRR